MGRDPKRERKIFKKRDNFNNNNNKRRYEERSRRLVRVENEVGVI